MLSKTIEYLSILLVAHKEGSFSFLLFLFGVFSDSFQPILACDGLFWVIPVFKSVDVTECFDEQVYYRSISCTFYYKARQVLLQSRA